MSKTPMKPCKRWAFVRKDTGEYIAMENTPRHKPTNYTNYERVQRVLILPANACCKSCGARVDWKAKPQMEISTHARWCSHGYLHSKPHLRDDNCQLPCLGCGAVCKPVKKGKA